jgi:hypothetical protein
MSYAGDWYDPDDDDTSEPVTANTLFMQEIVDGYNLNYTFSCSFKNLSGESIPCDNGITDSTRSTPNIFSIEQVTS